MSALFHVIPKHKRKYVRLTKVYVYISTGKNNTTVECLLIFFFPYTFDAVLESRYFCVCLFHHAPAFILKKKKKNYVYTGKTPNVHKMKPGFFPSFFFVAQQIARIVFIVLSGRYVTYDTHFISLTLTSCPVTTFEFYSVFDSSLVCGQFEEPQIRSF